MAFSSAMFGPNTGTSMAQRNAAGAAGKKISQMGRGGDTMAIHATPFTRNLLKALGGSGGINPKTGLTEFMSPEQYSPIGNNTSYGEVEDGNMIDGGMPEYSNSFDEETGTYTHLGVTGLNPADYQASVAAYNASQAGGSAGNSADEDDQNYRGAELEQLADLADAAEVDSSMGVGPEWMDKYNHGVIDGKKYGRLAYDNMINTGNVSGGLPASTENNQPSNLGSTTYVMRLGSDGNYSPVSFQGSGRVSTDQEITEEEYNQVTSGVSDQNRTQTSGLQAGAAQGFTSRDILNASVGNAAQFLEYDINGDGEVTSSDALAFAKQTGGYDVGLSQTSGLQAGAAQGFTSEDILNASVGNQQQFLEYDINGDGKITSADARAYLLDEVGKQTGGGFTEDEVFLDEDGNPYTGDLDVNGRPYTFENGEAKQQAEKVAEVVLANTDPNDFAGQIAALKAEIAKLSTSAEEEQEVEGINDFDGLIAKLTELFEKYMTSGYSPSALLNMFGFTDGNVEKDFNYMIPTYSGSDNVYTRKAVKDRDTGEVRYINVPIGDMASGGGSFQENRRAGFGSMF